MALTKRHLLLVTAIPPTQGSGSGIILLRHIRKFLRDGWRVTVCVPVDVAKQLKEVDRGISVLAMPHRLRWWPPVRDRIELSWIVRAKLQAAELELALVGDRPTHVLTLVWGEASRIATEIASRLNLPLVSIFHDQEEAWAKDILSRERSLRRVKRVVGSSQIVFSVSQEILWAYDVPTARGRILLPIPGDSRSIDPSRDQVNHGPIKVFFGGSLHAWQEPNFVALAAALARRGGYLVLLTPPENQVWRRLSELYPQTQRRDPLEKNEDAVQMLASEADAILVSYSMSFAEQPWAVGSFPSKLVDFSRSGMPILVIAPPGSATHSWCTANNWRTLAADIRDSTLDTLVCALASQVSKAAAAAQVRWFAQTAFLADRIHSELAVALSQLSDYGP